MLRWRGAGENFGDDEELLAILLEACGARLREIGFSYPSHFGGIDAEMFAARSMAQKR